MAARRTELEARIAAAVRERSRDPAFTVTACAREVGVSVSHLREVCTLTWGVGPHDLIEGHRLACAVRLLRSRHRVAEAAREAGYSYTATLRRALKKRLGVTPVEARELDVASVPSVLAAEPGPAAPGRPSAARGKRPSPDSAPSSAHDGTDGRLAGGRLSSLPGGMTGDFVRRFRTANPALEGVRRRQ